MSHCMARLKHNSVSISTSFMSCLHLFAQSCSYHTFKHVEMYAGVVHTNAVQNFFETINTPYEIYTLFCLDHSCSVWWAWWFIMWKYASCVLLLWNEMKLICCKCSKTMLTTHDTGAHAGISDNGNEFRANVLSTFHWKCPEFDKPSHLIPAMGKVCT